MKLFGVFSGDIRVVMWFNNGLGASIIHRPGCRGYSDDKWEVAVLDSSGELLYNTPITDDVVGNVSSEELEPLLKRISEL